MRLTFPPSTPSGLAPQRTSINLLFIKIALSAFTNGLSFNGTQLYRGIMCNVFYMKSTGVYYWARQSDNMPIRSSNQANDPGDTDYFDVTLGPQDPALWTVPAYCSNRVSYGCPPFPV